MKANFNIKVPEKVTKTVSSEQEFEEMLVKAGAKGSYMVFTDFMDAPKHLQVIDRMAKEQLYEGWLRNFAYNYDCAKNSSIGARIPKRRAIIVGAGPSLAINKHLLHANIADSDIFATDRALLELPFTPEYVVTVDAHEKIRKYYANNNFIHRMLSITCSPALDGTDSDHWYIPSIDEQTDRIMHIMTGLPIIQTYGNVGATACSIAEHLGYQELILVGFDYGYPEGTPPEQMDWYNRLLEASGGNEELVKKAHQIIEHPVYKTRSVSDPVYDYYREAFYGFISKTKCRVVNASEGGTLWHKKLECVKLADIFG